MVHFIRLLNINMNIKFPIEKDGKICTKCLVWKPWKDYGKSNYSSYGHNPDCKECRIKISALARIKLNEVNQEKKIDNKRFDQEWKDLKLKLMSEETSCCSNFTL